MLSVTYKPFMLSVIMLNIVVLSAIMLNVIMLNAIMLSVKMLSFVAPAWCAYYFNTVIHQSIIAEKKKWRHDIQRNDSQQHNKNTKLSIKALDAEFRYAEHFILQLLNWVSVGWMSVSWMSFRIVLWRQKNICCKLEKITENQKDLFYV